MGHLTVVAQDVDQALATARGALERLAWADEAMEEGQR
jgi:hypothetical protein